MPKFARLIAVLVVLTTMLLTLSSHALAGSGPKQYIQINNGTIVTNSGQTFQVVVQFGNQGNANVVGAGVFCVTRESLGSIGSFYKGPFKDVDLTTVAGYRGIGFSQDGFWSGTSFKINQGLDIKPGQNYNVSFDFKVTAAKGANAFITCSIRSKSGTTMAQVPVRVQ